MAEIKDVRVTRTQFIPCSAPPSPGLFSLTGLWSDVAACPPYPWKPGDPIPLDVKRKKSR